MRKRFHGLKRPKIRQSWKKYNLYNLSRIEDPPFRDRTYFQQKWTSKALTRAYHGETIKEKHWQRMFRPVIRSVIPMDHRYLARSDGSEQAAGRGSGLEPAPEQKPKPFPKTPYMNMMYAPAERRLDTAIFRSLFASSLRQARQFVVHGWVKVNGEKMIYPGYQLNPGDMFQVEPERVLYATGAPKSSDERATDTSAKANKSTEDAELNEDGRDNEEDGTKQISSEAQEADPEDPKKTLSSLLNHAKSISSAPSGRSLPAKHKQDLREFQHLLRRTLSRSSTSTTLSDSLDAQLLELTSRLNISPPPTQSTGSQDQQQPSPPQPQRIDGAALALSATDNAALKRALAEARENPIDPSKPYATPWRPRDYMSAFAFIPRYLEVHQRICSAVYLRHPVARPGLGEVPTPYGLDVNGLAFNWYLRRR
ncbi:mitochondrial 37S ribosomal protein nam9 [Loxospora ochrophaea]|nr:mitochondrial 37S ribosomal protein nam9 [Loxospora ochrophaea]